MPNLSDFAPSDFTPLISAIESKIFTPIAPLRVTAWLTKEPVPFSRRSQGKKINLAPGEEKVVTFTINEKDLRFFNDKLKWASEPGKFNVFIGLDSQDVKQTSFMLK